MKAYRIIGILFVILMVSMTGYVLLKNVRFTPAEGKQITATYSNEKNPERLEIYLGSGILRVFKNLTISGWYIVAKYDENVGEPSIKFTNGVLDISMKAGILIIYYNTTREIDFTLLNGVATIINYNDTVNITGQVTNGNIKLRSFYSNVYVNLKVLNGQIELTSLNCSMMGNLNVKNGIVDMMIKTSGGGVINYEVLNGDANVFTVGFNETKILTDNGVQGSISRDGEGVDINVHLDNGDATLVVIGL